MRQSPPAGKVTAMIVRDAKGMLLVDYLRNKGKTITGEHYTELVGPASEQPKFAKSGLTKTWENSSFVRAGGRKTARFGLCSAPQTSHPFPEQEKNFWDSLRTR